MTPLVRKRTNSARRRRRGSDSKIVVFRHIRRSIGPLGRLHTQSREAKRKRRRAVFVGSNLSTHLGARASGSVLGARARDVYATF